MQVATSQECIDKAHVRFVVLHLDPVALSWASGTTCVCHIQPCKVLTAFRKHYASKTLQLSDFEP